MTAQLEPYRRWLYFMAHELGDPDQVDDLAQEGYIAMWRALKVYDPMKGALPSWLTKAARMRMTDVARGHGQPFGSVSGRGTQRPKDVRALDAMPEGQVAELEERMAVWLDEGLALAYHRGQIHQALQGLSADQRRYVLLRFWHGMTATEIQPQVNGEVTWLWRTAKKHLRAELADLAA